MPRPKLSNAEMQYVDDNYLRYFDIVDDYNMLLAQLDQCQEECNVKQENLYNALYSIKRKLVYDIFAKDVKFVNKLMYYENELMLTGPDCEYKVSEFEKTWTTDDKSIEEALKNKKERKVTEK